MIKRRTISRAAALATVAILAAACGDATAPKAISTPPADAAGPSYDIAGTAVPTTRLGDTTFATFTVKHDEARTFVFDRHSAIAFPKEAICKTDAGYGPTMWDKSCNTTGKDVVITVKSYKGLDGHINTEFTPAIRFSPETSGVFLYLEDYPGAVPLWGEKVLYCNDLKVCVDESLTDSSLATYRDPVTGLYRRRIKHFSGYVVGVGKEGDGLVEGAL